MVIIQYLDVGQAHEILSNVNHKLVHEGRGNVEPILYVVEVEPVPNYAKYSQERKTGLEEHK